MDNFSLSRLEFMLHLIQKLNKMSTEYGFGIVIGMYLLKCANKITLRKAEYSITETLGDEREPIGVKFCLMLGSELR